MRLGGTISATVMLLAMRPGLAQTIQKAIATVSLADANVQNSNGTIMDIGGGRVMLTSGSSVTAKGHTAEVKLARGGAVYLCQSSVLHLAQNGEDTLLLGLDRGALEVKMKAGPGDVVVTPDLRFTVAQTDGGTGQFDLDMRVVPNGDTCVENRGRNAPYLSISDAFGAATYLLKPAQHVLFEHGSLREVVDREGESCGCPAAVGPETTQPVASASSNGAPVTPEQAAAAHPFPQAVSEGLATPAPPPPDGAEQTHVQVGTTLAYQADAASPGAVTAPAGAGEASAQPSEPAVKKSSDGFFAKIGRFFKRLFVR
jgi:hypothetical protein